MTYDEFINNILTSRGRFGIKDGIYKEQHHIKPKCKGGTNDTQNLIDLLPQEHYEAHKLLAKENPGDIQLHFAWYCVSHVTNSNNHIIKISAEEYAELREIHQNFVKIINKGHEPWNKGKIGVYSDETKKKMGYANIGNKYSLGRKHTPEAITKIKEKRAIQPPAHTTPHTEETKQKMSKIAKEKDRCPVNAIKIKDLTTDVIYRSVTRCCIELGVPKHIIWKILDTEKDWNGHKFIRIEE